MAAKCGLPIHCKTDFFCLLANTSEDKPHVNKSMVIVPAKTAGISFSEPLNKLGMRSTTTAQVYFDNVRTTAQSVGAEGWAS